MNLHHERMSAAFEKWHIEGLPMAAALHHFSDKDDGDFHDHPWGFTSHILSGGYLEEIITIEADGQRSVKMVHREAGTSHRVEATHIHRIVWVHGDGCWTFIVPGPAERETRFWRFGDRIESRPWHSTEWTAFGREGELGA